MLIDTTKFSGHYFLLKLKITNWLSSKNFIFAGDYIQFNTSRFQEIWRKCQSVVALSPPTLTELTFHTNLFSRLLFV